MKKKIIWLAVTFSIVATLVVAACAAEVAEEEEAVPAVGTAVEHDERGIVFALAGLYEQAITEFNKAIELDPEYAEAYNNRGNAYWNKGNFDRAIADYDKAIELDPEYAEAYSNRGFVYYLKGELTKAISDLEKCLELSDDPRVIAKAQQLLDQLK